MPPRIPVRFPWASGSSVPPSDGFTSSFCIRTFTSTPSTLALGPESPNYIEVPKPLQPTFPLKPDIKGHLPVPRDIFKTRSSTLKESDELIASSTKEPGKLKVPGPYSRDADYRLYKQKLAATRRTAFREGVKELHERKTTSEATDAARISRLQTEKAKLKFAPRRTVDVLTETSVPKGIRDFLADRLPVTPRTLVVQRRTKSYERRMAKQEAVRRARVHDLYTNARQFIVSEEQLDEAIEKAFGTDENPIRWDNKGALSPHAIGLSPWDGPIPEGVGDKLQKLKGGEGVGLARERVKKVAEALTGGKM